MKYLDKSGLTELWAKIKSKIPTKLSQLSNDNNYVSDASYVHTDNNYTTNEKTKLSGIAEGATKVTTDTVGGWGYTKNVGTVTGVKVNGSTKSPSSGVVDIGTVITAHQDISGKQDKSTLESDVAAAGFTKNTGTYSKPSTGIPKTDLASAVQTSLNRADSALQSHQDISGKENTSNKVTSWSSTTTDEHYPSERLVKSALDGKANSSHTHDDRYYTESEVDTKLSGKSDMSHTHDDRYYTESEVDTKLLWKADVSHTHDYIPNSSKGAADGVAELDENGKVPSSQLPYSVESTSNKVTSISSSSTDTQYPSAKAVYAAIQAGGGGTALTTDDYLTSAELQEIIGTDIVWDGTIE